MQSAPATVASLLLNPNIFLSSSVEQSLQICHSLLLTSLHSVRRHTNLRMCPYRNHHYKIPHSLPHILNLHLLNADNVNGHMRTLPPANRWRQHKYYKAAARYFIQSLPFLTRETVMYIGFLFVLFLNKSPSVSTFFRISTLCKYPPHTLLSLHGWVPLSYNIRGDAHRHHTVPSIFP